MAFRQDLQGWPGLGRPHRELGTGADENLVLTVAHGSRFCLTVKYESVVYVTLLLRVGFYVVWGS